MTENRLQLTGLLDRFARHAQRQIGATHLEDQVCRSETIAPKLGEKLGEYHTTGCGNETLFALPVGDDASTSDDFKKPDPAVVCVMDDMAYLFPRYGG